MQLSIPWLPLEIVVRRRPMPRTQVRIRDLMILTLLVAAGIYTWQNDDRRAKYQSLHSFHDGQERQTDWTRNVARMSATQFAREAERKDGEANLAEQSGNRATAKDLRREATDLRTVSDNQKSNFERLMRKAGYHRSLSAKYLAATYRPWVPLLPDPAAP